MLATISMADRSYSSEICFSQDSGHVKRVLSLSDKKARFAPSGAIFFSRSTRHEISGQGVSPYLKLNDLIRGKRPIRPLVLSPAFVEQRNKFMIGAREGEHVDLVGCDPPVVHRSIQNNTSG